MTSPSSLYSGKHFDSRLDLTNYRVFRPFQRVWRRKDRIPIECLSELPSVWEDSSFEDVHFVDDRIIPVSLRDQRTALNGLILEGIHQDSFEMEDQRLNSWRRVIHIVEWIYAVRRLLNLLRSGIRIRELMQ